MLEIRKASEADLDDVCRMYDEIIDSTEGKECSPLWTKGVYPNRDYFRGTIERGELYLAFCDGCIAGGVVRNHRQADGYGDVPWDAAASPAEVYTIHTLGVHPAFQHRNIATEISRRVIDDARKDGMKAIRLDVIDGNYPSVLLYRRMGFTDHGQHILHYEGMDDIPFTMMELVL